jgi:hypothetical protein
MLAVFSVFAWLLSFGIADANGDSEWVRTRVGEIPFSWVADEQQAEVVLLDQNQSPARFLIDDREPFPVHRTLSDVRDDLHDITGYLFKTTHAVPKRSFDRYLIVVGTKGTSRALASLESRQKLDLSALADRPEAFLLKTIADPFPGCKGAMVIAGSDPRGTIYGLYSLVQSGLGVDPLRFWTEQPIEQRSTLLLGSMQHLEDTPRFRYRGWFINDEDLLMGWHPAGPTRVAPELIEVILETSLRLRQNMIIPMTLFNLEVPTDRVICDMIERFGMLLTTHHAMPLGVWGRDWDLYWQQKEGKVPSYSWMQHKDRFRQIWEYGAERYSPYMGIWQTGLRGKGDDPIWRYDRDFPEDPQERGRLIREAVEMQIDILERATGKDASEIPMTTTLWFEALDLYNAGHLRYPDPITLIVADWGRGNMDHLDDMGWDEPFPENRAGIYYHLAFQDGFDSHLVQTVHPHRIREAFDLVFKYNLTDYCLVNVANVREYVMGIQAMSDLLTTGEFEPDAFYHRWCTSQFGSGVAEELTRLYKRWFDIPFRHGDTEDEHWMVQGLVQYGLNLLDAARRGDVTPERYGVKARPDPEVRRRWPTYRHWVHLQNRRDFDQTISWLHEHIGEDTREWTDLYGELKALEDRVLPERRTFYQDNVLLQCFTAQQASRWMYDITRGVVAYQQGDMAEARTEIIHAREALQSILDRQDTAEHGKWKDYYRSHSTVPFAAALQSADEFLQALEHQLLHRSALARVNFRTPHDAEHLQGFRPGATWRSMPVDREGCASKWNRGELPGTPAVVVVELRTTPQAPVDVHFNGEKIGTIQSERQGIFTIDERQRNADTYEVALRYPAEARVTHIRGIALYGPLKSSDEGQ